MAERVRSLITPPVNASGIFTAYAPFTLPITQVYRCDAIRTFQELAKRGINVYETYYKDKGISEASCQVDADLRASIVTLVSSTGEFVYIPNTYIESYPGDAGVRYDRKVIICEVGLLPVTTDLDFLLPMVQDVIKTNAGVDNVAEYVTAPYTGVVTHDQHVQLEATRRVAIRNHVPLQEQISTLSTTNTALTKMNTDLTSVVVGLQTDLADATAKVATLVAANAQLNKDKTALTTTLNETKVELTTAKATVADQLSVIAGLNAEIDRLNG